MSKTAPNFYDDLKDLRREVRALKASSTISDTINRIYPVGAVYITATNDNPGTQLGGTWTAVTTDISGVYLWKRTA